MKKSSARNEALDELVYAYSALHRLYQLYDRRTIWDQFERAVRPIEGEPVVVPARKSRKAFNVLG
jgi:phage terminase large subunit GpA-like protein